MAGEGEMDESVQAVVNRLGVVLFAMCEELNDIGLSRKQACMAMGDAAFRYGVAAIAVAADAKLPDLDAIMLRLRSEIGIDGSVQS